MFWIKNKDKKIRYAPSKPQFFFIKVGFVEKKKKKKKSLFTLNLPTHQNGADLKRLNCPLKKRGKKCLSEKINFIFLP